MRMVSNAWLFDLAGEPSPELSLPVTASIQTSWACRCGMCLWHVHVHVTCACACACACGLCMCMCHMHVHVMCMFTSTTTYMTMRSRTHRQHVPTHDRGSPQARAHNRRLLNTPDCWTRKHTAHGPSAPPAQPPSDMTPTMTAHPPRAITLSSPQAPHTHTQAPPAHPVDTQSPASSLKIHPHSSLLPVPLAEECSSLLPQP